MQNYDQKNLKGISLFKSFPKKRADFIDLNNMEQNCCLQFMDKKSIDLPPIIKMHCTDQEIRDLFIDQYYERSQFFNIFSEPKILDGRIIANDQYLIHESMPPYSRKAQQNVDLSKDYNLVDFYQEKHLLFTNQLQKKNVLKLKGVYAFCFHKLSSNYFHWHMQAISVIWFLRKFKLEDQVKILIPNNISKWQIDALYYYELKDKNVVFYAPDDIVIPEKLIYTSLSWLQFHNGWYEHPLDFIKSFRKIYNNNNSKQDKFIYISRSGHPRSCINESQLEAALSAINFEICSPEKLNYFDQAELFHSAKIIVAAPGAALTNLIHTNPETTLIEIWSEASGKNGTNEISKWGRFARVLELNDHIYISENTENDRAYFAESGYKVLDSWALNIDQAINFIKKIINK